MIAPDDRRLAIGRSFSAPPAAVWRAWTDPDILPRWFGPAGFRCETKEIDLRDGGLWRFDMVGHGLVFPNRHHALAYTPMTRIHFLMDDDSDAAPPYDVTVTLTPEGEGTRLDQVMTFPSAAKRAEVEGFGAVEMGHQTLAKLAALLDGPPA